MFVSRLLAVLAVLSCLPTAHAAHPRSPEALAAVGERATQAVSQGLTPVVLFDIDDTLIETRARTARILSEYAESSESETLDPAVRELLADLPRERIAYELSDTLGALGVTDPAALSAAEAFWKARFFTSDYVRDDVPVRGASEYARWLTGLGAHVVYLTGRPEDTMREGTVANLAALAFPESLLIMKPHLQDDDLAFKRAAFERVRQTGEVVGVFENEPRNINAMHAAFPAAVAVFVDTIHSRRPDTPAEGVAWVGDFEVTSLGF